MIRRLTHLHHFPSGGEVAHITAHVLDPGAGRLLDCLPAGVRPLPLGGRGRPAAALGGGPVGVDALGAAVKDVFFKKKILTRPDELKRHYDVVIIGGGSHGSRRRTTSPSTGITDVADPGEELHRLRRRRAQHDDRPLQLPHARGCRLLQRERRLYERLSAELDFNLMFSQHGHFTLAHSDRSLVVQTERAEVNKLLGIDSRVVDAARRSRSSARRSTSPARASPGRSSARSTTRPAGSSATTPSSGATRSRSQAPASRSTRTPR